MDMKVSINNLLLSMLAIFVMFLPRTLYIAGAYSFRTITLGVLLIFLFYTHGKVKVHPFLKNRFLWLYFGVIIIIYLRYNAIVSLIGYLLDTVVLFFLLTNIISTVKRRTTFLNIFSHALLVYTILGVIETVTGFNIWNVVTGANLTMSRYGLHRTFGSFTTPINNGMFLILCMPLILHLVITNKGTKKGKYFIFIYIMIWVDLLCTISRGPILVAVGLHLVWLIKMGMLSFIKKHIIPVLAVCVLSVGLYSVPTVSNAVDSFYMMFAAMFSEDAASSIKGTFGHNAEGVGQRQELYEWVWDAVQGDVLLGKGPHQAFDYDFVDSSGTPRTKISIENQYLACLFRYGIIGLTTMVLFFISCLKFVYKGYKLAEYEKNKLSFDFLVLTTLILYFIGLLTVAMADDIRMFYILLAIYFLSSEKIIKFMNYSALRKKLIKVSQD